MSAFKRLGPAILPEADIRDVEQTSGRETDLAERGRLESDTATAESLTNRAGTVNLAGRFRPPWIPTDRVAMIARELDELGGSDRGPLAFFDDESDEEPQAGWYESNSVDVQRAHPDLLEVWQYDVRLERAGTRHSHWRTVATAPQTVTHPFGDGTDATVWVPAAARKLVWFDPDDQTLEGASGSTVPSAVGELRDLSIPADIDRPQLLYDVPYDIDTWGTYAFDTRGHTQKHDADGVRQWQTIHETSHDIGEETVVLSSKRLRLYLREQPSSLIAAERWEGGSWTDVDLLGSAWDVLDVDLQTLGQHRIDAQMLFVAEPELSVTDAVYAIDVSLSFGSDEVLVRPADGEDDPLPQGLEQVFDPIAQSSERAAGATRTLVPREVVRQ